MFLETYNLPKSNQEESENLDRLITPSEIEAVIKQVPTNKSPGPDVFISKFYQTCQEEITHVKLLQKIQEEGSFPIPLYEANTILIPKPEKNTAKK